MPNPSLFIILIWSLMYWCGISTRSINIWSLKNDSLPSVSPGTFPPAASYTKMKPKEGFSEGNKAEETTPKTSAWRHFWECHDCLWCPITTGAHIVSKHEVSGSTNVTGATEQRRFDQKCDLWGKTIKAGTLLIMLSSKGSCLKTMWHKWECAERLYPAE